MDDIIEKLTEKKKELGVTNGWIAEKSGVPEQTVAKVMNGSTKNPGSATLNPIAAALGISIDTGQDLAPPEDPQEHYIALLIQNYESQTERLVTSYEKQLKHKDKWIRILAIAVALIVVFIFAVMLYDITNLDRGWVRYQQMMGNIKGTFDAVKDYLRL